MTTYAVGSGHTSSGITLNTGDTMNVLAGGTAVSTTVNGPVGTTFNGGFQDVFGKTIGTVVNNDGAQLVNSGGVTTGTVVNSGGLDVLSGGTASGTIVNDGGFFNFVSGSTAVGTVINSGGTVELESTSDHAIGTIVNAGGDSDRWRGVCCHWHHREERRDRFGQK